MALPHAETNSLQRHPSSRLLLSSQIGEKFNVREPQRSYALNAIDRAIKFWKGRAVPRPRPLRAPWLLAPDWRQHLKKPLSQHVPLMHHFPQMPISYGQFVQPQGNGQLLGRHEKTYLPLHATSTVLIPTTGSTRHRQPPCPQR
jgi:hypothetical protein